MSAFSPLATILTQNKLTGNNYVEWKGNLNIVLTAEDHIYVLSTPCPPEPPANAAAAVKLEFDKWKKSNGMARCYMLASMAGVLQHQFQLNDSAASIMDSFKGIFGDHGRPPVRKHILKMIGFFK